MICGSTASDVALSPCFQFKTDAQSSDYMWLQNEMMAFTSQCVVDKFLNQEERIWMVTFGMNAKGKNIIASFSVIDNTTNSIFYLCQLLLGGMNED